MKNYKVLLCDEENEFVFALMNYINRNSQIPILAMAFTEPEEMFRYLVEHEADLIVTGMMVFNQENISAIHTIPVLQLLNRSDQLKEMQEGWDYISKYTTASVLVKKMLQILSKKKQFLNIYGNSVSMAVYSPIGRCGKTILSRGLCMNWIAQSGTAGRGIYLGMEEFGEASGTHCEMETLLYYLKQRTENLSMKMKALSKEEQGYDVIPSALTYQELRELTKEDMNWLIEEIRKEGYYEMLLADIGAGSLMNFEILKEFDVIYLPYLQDGSSKQKLTALFRSLKKQGIWESIADKSYPVDAESREWNIEAVHGLEEARLSGKLKSLSVLAEQSADYNFEGQ